MLGNTGPYLVKGIVKGLATCKKSTLPPVLFLQLLLIFILNEFLAFIVELCEFSISILGSNYFNI